MNKLMLLGTVVLSVLAFTGYKTVAQMREENKNMNTESAKVLVAYYSYSGNTKEVAEAIHEKVGGDIFEIKTEGTYPDEYRPMTVQAKKEIEDGWRPKLTTSVADISKYDVVFLGSPNWWGSAAFWKTMTCRAKPLFRLSPMAVAASRIRSEI